MTQHKDRGHLDHAEECAVVKRFVEKLVKNSKPLPPDVAQLINDNFWDLAGNSKPAEKGGEG